MLSETYKETLEKQQYRFVGEHSAVKICHWTKNMIRGEGGCYKLTFYGIMSHQCMQMTTSMSCANRCSFCWRGHKAPVSENWDWDVDDPSFIIKGSEKAHHLLLTGLNGYPKVNKGIYKESKEIKHVALSLTGEPIIYPKINELIAEFHAKDVSTFLVTNAQYPEQIKNLKPITQLYLSLDAPNKELLKEVDKPLFSDFWERFLASIDAFALKKERTCVRLTCIKGINMVDPKEYAVMLERADPDFIEVKAYVFVGASRELLKKENMPLHEEVVVYSKELKKHLSQYEIVSEHIPSRVILLAKKKYKIDGIWHTWLDFPRFNELALSGKEFSGLDYSIKTPKVGLSGKGTLDRRKEFAKMKEEVHPEM